MYLSPKCRMWNELTCILRYPHSADTGRGVAESFKLKNTLDLHISIRAGCDRANLHKVVLVQKKRKRGEKQQLIPHISKYTGRFFLQRSPTPFEVEHVLVFSSFFWHLFNGYHPFGTHRAASQTQQQAACTPYVYINIQREKNTSLPSHQVKQSPAV